MTQLPPVPRQIGIFPNLIARQSETLVLKEKVLSLSGDTFDISLANGQPILKVQGSAVSLSGRKKMTDMQGNHLFDIRREHLSLSAKFYLEDANKNNLMTVKGSFNILRLFLGNLIPSKSMCQFRSIDGKEEQLLIKGGFMANSADIIEESTGIVVARIERKILSGKDILFGQQSYAVVIAPGVDMALVAAMCICLDEKHHEK